MNTFDELKIKDTEKADERTLTKDKWNGLLRILKNRLDPLEKNFPSIDSPYYHLTIKASLDIYFKDDGGEGKTRLTIDKNGSVGIGVEKPTAKLEVDGRIKDATGFVAPVGMIVPFAGHKTKVPQGWLICHGGLVKKSKYLDLWNTIQYSWGQNLADDTVFKLPDFRGMFLRGVADAAGTSRDPDANSRTNGWGGNKGNKVGSYQGDSFRSHNHNIPNGGLAHRDGKKTPQRTDSSSKELNLHTYKSMVNTGGKETRPRNAYVHYMIKY